MSVVAFTLYSYDKAQALKSRRRISENKLLFFSFIGGTIGSLISMLLFRHKIKKPSFMIKFSILVILQILAVYFYITKGIHLL